MRKQICISFIAAPCLVIKDATFSAQFMISTVLSPSIVIFNAAMKYIISKNRFEESLFYYFTLFCCVFISLTLSQILMFLFETIHSYSLIFQALFAFFVYTQVPFKYLRHMIITNLFYLFFCRILIYNPSCESINLILSTKILTP